MPSHSLIALPGFLGCKKDWDCFDFGVERFYPIDLYEEPSFEKFAKRLNKQAELWQAPRVLMGYSLGARLALHAILDNPKLWSKAIFISGHSGLAEKDRAARKQNDAIWADAFKMNPWENVIEKWEAQEVFKTCRYSFKREEKNYSREFLAHCLTCYSLGCQEDLQEKIAKLDLPILWITGDKDAKFSKLAANLSLNKLSQKINLPCGHRAPWELKEDFQKVVYSFLKDE